MTKPLTELFEKAVEFSEEESWRRCGYDSEKEPHVKFIIGGARGENHSRKPIDLATKKLIEALEKILEQHVRGGASSSFSAVTASEALAEFRASLEDGE